jgi:hypothetical protein
MNTSADRIRESLLMYRRLAGEFLPPEPQLARELGVGRSSIREAIARLIGEGLLYIVPGKGTRVEGWLWSGSFDLLRVVLQLKRGTPFAKNLVADVLLLRRALYAHIVDTSLDQLNLEFVGAEILGMRLGGRLGLSWRDISELPALEERVLVTIASGTGRFAVPMLAHAIRRFLFQILDFADERRDL